MLALALITTHNYPARTSMHLSLYRRLTTPLYLHLWGGKTHTVISSALYSKLQTVWLAEVERPPLCSALERPSMFWRACERALNKYIPCIMTTCPPHVRNWDAFRMQADEPEFTRHKVRAFLHGHSCYELIPESGKVVVLDVGLPIRQAFHALHEQVRFCSFLPPAVLLGWANRTSCGCGILVYFHKPLWLVMYC